MIKNATDLLQQLVRIPSFTPDKECVNFLAGVLNDIGFDTEVKVFDNTANLYATIGNKNGYNLCFAGHTDVVPLIDESKWKYDPFGGLIIDGKIYGRGTVDMKGGIAAFVSAVQSILKEQDLNSLLSDKCISLLITGDEEGDGLNGTNKMLKYLHDNAKCKIDACIIGEPTCRGHSLDSIHIGRRGSLNFLVNVTGTEGHVAYSDNIDNPITKTIEVCHLLKKITFAPSDQFWNRTNLEITSVNASNQATNVILKSCSFTGNVRFNKYDTVDGIVKQITATCDDICHDQYSLEYKSTHRGYASRNLSLANLCLKAINGVCNSSFTTSGGVTDGSFIINYCDNICELGPKEKMAHKIDEYIEIEDLQNLTHAYYSILKEFFISKNSDLL